MFFLLDILFILHACFAIQNKLSSLFHLILPQFLQDLPYLSDSYDTAWFSLLFLIRKMKLC